MDSDEPTLVPQWLKGGAASSPFFSVNNTAPSASRVNLNLEGNDQRAQQADKEDKNKTAIDRAPRKNGFAEATPRGSDPNRSWRGTNSLAPPPARKEYRPPPAGKHTVEDRHLEALPAPNGYSRGGHQNGRVHDDFTIGYASEQRSESHAEIPAHNRVPLHRTKSVQVEANGATAAAAANPKVTFEKEFPSLADGRGSNGSYVPSVAPYKENFLTSRASLGWTSKLADAPPPTQPAPSPLTRANAPQAAPPSQPQPTLHAAQHPPVPKMSEALQHSLAAGTAAGHAHPDKQRLELLAVKQSKQLVPVLATSSKGKAPAVKAPPPQRTESVKAVRADTRRQPELLTATLIRKNSVPLERTSSLSSKLPTPAGPLQAPLMTAASLPLSPTSATAQPAGPRADRLSFFQSLRRKTAETGEGDCKGDGKGELGKLDGGSRGGSSSSLSSQDMAGLLADAATGGHTTQCPATQNGHAPEHHPGDTLDAQPNGVLLAGEEEAPARVAAAADGMVVRKDVVDVPVSPEEAAFLRSLGWTEEDDENEGGLTEEEIAAFQATLGSRKPGSPLSQLHQQPQQRSPPMWFSGSKRCGREGPRLPCIPASWGSQISTTTDTDSD